MKIDLQIHTTFSDGHNSPKEIAELAHNAGVGMLSATEHDNISSFKELEKECAKYGIKAIPGVEISTKYEGKTLHILGYNIDVDNQDLKDFLLNIVQLKKQMIVAQFPILNKILRDAGKNEANPILYGQREDEKYFSMPGLSLFLFEEGILGNRNDGFTYMEGIIKTTPSIKTQDAIEIIHKAGGKAVLSHPLAPKISLKNISQDKIKQEKILSELMKQGLDGLECYGTGQDKEDISFCLQLAEKYNLIITAGSDWHGRLNQLGDGGIKSYLPYYLESFGDLEVPEEAVQKIIKDLGIKI